MISSPAPDKIRHYEHAVTASIVTANVHPSFKTILDGRGFRWHAARRNWYKFSKDYETLRAECIAIWQLEPGKILFSLNDRSERSLSTHE